MMELNRKNCARISTVKIPNSTEFDQSIKKNNPSKNINFAYSLRPIYYFSRLFGLLPFSIIHDMNGDVQETRVTFFDILWFIISMCIYLILAFLSYANMQLPTGSNESPLLVLSDYVLLIAGLLWGAIIIILDMYNRSKLIDIVKKFTAFDMEVMKSGINFDYKTKYRYFLGWNLAATVVSLVLAVSTYNTYKNIQNNLTTHQIMFLFASYIFQHFVSAVVLTTYVVMIFCLHRRFDSINSLLSNEFLGKHAMPIHFRKQESIAFIKFTGKMHDLLTGIMELLNRCYSLQAMFNIGATFIFSVLTFYTFYRYILEQNEFFRQVTLVHFYWQIFYLTYAYMVIYAGSVVTSKGKKTSQLIHNVINKCNDSDVVLALSQVSQQIQNRYPIATCGLFVFDWTLLYTMIGATATYLTIIVQFDTPNHNRIRNETTT